MTSLLTWPENYCTSASKRLCISCSTPPLPRTAKHAVKKTSLLRPAALEWERFVVSRRVFISRAFPRLLVDNRATDFQKKRPLFTVSPTPGQISLLGHRFHATSGAISRGIGEETTCTRMLHHDTSRSFLRLACLQEMRVSKNCLRVADSVLAVAVCCSFPP